MTAREGWTSVFGYGSLIWKVGSRFPLVSVCAHPSHANTAESSLATRQHARVHQTPRQEIRTGLA